MESIFERIDSLAFGRNVLQIKNPTAHIDFHEFEESYILKWAPFYVYLKIPAENLSLIHHFENHGFRLAEFQLEMTRRLSNKFDVSMFKNFLAIFEVGPEEDIEPILRLADAEFVFDRVFVDPELVPAMAKRRYRLYIEQSWQAIDERLVKFLDMRDGSLIGFHTHKKIGQASMLHFLGAVASSYKRSGASIGAERLLLNKWIDEGIKSLTTYISLTNYNIMEAEYKAFNFKAKQTSAVLRKIYANNSFV
jgi:hypothetical protein